MNEKAPWVRYQSTPSMATGGVSQDLSVFLANQVMSMNDRDADAAMSLMTKFAYGVVDGDTFSNEASKMAANNGKTVKK